MSGNFSKPRYLGIEEDCQTSRTQGDLIILLFYSPISPGECVMARGFLPTSPPVFVYVVVSTFIAMKTLLRGCRWWCQALARRWLCESLLMVLMMMHLLWSTESSRECWCSWERCCCLLRGFFDFEVHVEWRFHMSWRLERPTVTWVWNSSIEFYKGSAGPLHGCKWDSKCFNCRCDHWMTSRFSLLLRAWNI